VLGIHQRVVMSAEENKIGLPVEFLRRECRISPWAVATRGDYMSDLADHRSTICVCRISDERILASGVRTPAAGLPEQDLDGLLGVLPGHECWPDDDVGGLGAQGVRYA
jgi:hypothetical protein